MRKKGDERVDGLTMKVLGVVGDYTKAEKMTNEEVIVALGKAIHYLGFVSGVRFHLENSPEKGDKTDDDKV